jgi:heterodisulfide reductase subunit A-like polyferredoxin
MNESAKQPILVVGAGIAGVTAALEAAEAGTRVVLVEDRPSIGGRVVNLYPGHKGGAFQDRVDGETCL